MVVVFRLELDLEICSLLVAMTMVQVWEYRTIVSSTLRNGGVETMALVKTII